MKLITFCFAVMLSLQSTAGAQEYVNSQKLPDSSGTHKFWTLENKVNFSIFSGELRMRSRPKSD
jgi:hypothetical protein